MIASDGREGKKTVDMAVLKHLPFFLAIAQTQNFRLAARQLNIAQPALSRRMSDLEKTLGVTLFERRSKGVLLSEVGRIFYADLLQVSGQLKQAQRRVKRAMQGQVGTLRMGFTSLVARHAILAEACNQFRRDRPEVDLVLTCMMSLDQLRAIRADQLDAGLVYHPHVTRDSGLESREILAENIVLAVSSRSPLARRKTIALRDLRDEDFVSIARGRGLAYYDLVYRACLDGGLQPRIVQEVDDRESLLSLVSLGAGIAFVHDAVALQRRPRVVFRPIADLHVPMRLLMVWPQQRHSRLIEEFAACLCRDTAASPPG